MSLPHSEPIVPPQPKLDSYGVLELALFKTYSRDSLRAAFGIEAPAFDPSRPIKNWFDSTVDVSSDTNVAVYKVIAQDARGQWGIRQMVMPAREAATLNLQGSIQYPPYVIAPTKAHRDVNAYIWPVTLSLRSEADALLKELGLEGQELYDEGVGSVFPVIYGEEPRRQWFFIYRDAVHSIGGLLAIKNARGVGAPGRWVVKDDIQWVPDPTPPTGLLDSRPPREMPLRELLPNEKLAHTLAGPVIVRTDRQQAQAEANGQFTEVDRQALREIQRVVQELARR